MSGRILLVDDDPAVLSSLRRALEHEGYEVLVAEDGEVALQAASSEEIDLVVLDVLLPGLDGFTVCERIRSSRATPILMLTAKDTVPDRVSGLDRGADDYLVKPFALDELLARIRALMRRGNTHVDSLLEYGGVALDTQTREVWRHGEPINLTRRQNQLLEVFLRHPRQALSRDHLCQVVWGYSFEGESNFVDVAVKELRQKIEADGSPRLIQTIRGFGYALRED
jgi:two-component system response regulator MprA